jgi:hypothetical protein
MATDDRTKVIGKKKSDLRIKNTPSKKDNGQEMAVRPW